MIDIENYVVNAIQSKYTSKSITIPVVSTYQSFSETIPCVYVRETNNTVLSSTQDATDSERHVRVVYQIDIVSNEKPVKNKVKKLLSIADEAMREMKFTRTNSDILTDKDRTVAWARTRYTAIVGEPVKVGNTTTYQMYR